MITSVCFHSFGRLNFYIMIIRVNILCHEAMTRSICYVLGKVLGSVHYALGNLPGSVHYALGKCPR